MKLPITFSILVTNAIGSDDGSVFYSKQAERILMTSNYENDIYIAILGQHFQLTVCLSEKSSVLSDRTRALLLEDHAVGSDLRSWVGVNFTGDQTLSREPYMSEAIVRHSPRKSLLRRNRLS
jgi:hypothetical protein